VGETLELVRRQLRGVVGEAGAEAELARDDGAARAGDDVRADLRQPALGEVGVPVVERVRDGELEDAVAEELEPLVRRRARGGPGGMGEGGRRALARQRLDQLRELPLREAATGAR
jgi:hypothetical protein